MSGLLDGPVMETDECECCGEMFTTERIRPPYLCAACALGSLRYGSAFDPVTAALIDRGLFPERYEDAGHE